MSDSAPDAPDRPLRAGLALAALITTVYCAERLNAAARVVESLRANGAPEVGEAWPGAIVGWWVAVALAFLALGLYVARRFLEVVPAATPCRRLVVVLAYTAVGLWLAWQATGIASLAGTERPRVLAPWLYWGASACVGAVLALGGRGAVGSLGWGSTPLVRIHLIFLAALFLLVFRMPFTSAQLTDVLRGWGDGPLSRALAGVASVLLLGAVIRASSRRLLLRRPDTRGRVIDWLAALPRPGVPSWWRRLAGCPAVVRLLAVGAGALAVYGALKAPAFGPLLFAAIAVAFLALATRATEAPPEKSDREKAPLHRLSGTLGTAPLAILVVGLVGATTDSLLLPDERAPTDERLLAGTVVVILLFGLLAGTAHLPLWSARQREREPRWLPGLTAFAGTAGFAVQPTLAALILLALGLVLAFRGMGSRGKPELWAARGGFAGLALAVYADPIEVPEAAGAFAVAMLGAAGLMAGLHALGHVAARRELRFAPSGRTRSAPVLTLFFLWLLVGLLNGPGDAHRARTVPAAGEPITIAQAVSDWLAVDRPEVGAAGYEPMLIVAASGGGSKAAYWTDLVLDCVFGAGAPTGKRADECGESPEAPRRRSSLFLTSSVSGGSIGVHHLLEHFEDAGAKDEWVKDSAGREVLSPLVAWGLFHDLPSFLVGLPTDPRRCDRLPCRYHADRAVVLEAAIAGGLGGKRLLDSGGPVTIFNATVGMLGWRRAMLSRLSLARVPGCPPAGGPVAGAFDGHDLLRDEDVPMITAALLSARFPGLVPSARYGSSEKGEGCVPPTHPDVRIRDGGLIENTGLMTIVDLLPSILAEIDRQEGAAEVLPIVVSIDDDVPDMGRDNEYGGGLIGGLGLESSGDNSARARDTLIARCREGDLVYLRISPAPHVGAQAATGWEVSETSRRKDLVKSLQTGGAADEVARLQGLLDGSVVSSGC